MALDPNEFELSLDEGALRTLVRLGSEALTRMAVEVQPGDLVRTEERST